MASISRIIPFVQIGLSVLLIVVVLLQQSDAGLGGAFGGGDGSATYHTKRGLEKVLFYATFVIGILFAATALLAVVL